jgi:glycosyltransferase involved in cell wall biosynthesis
MRRLLTKAAALFPEFLFEFLELGYNLYSLPRTYFLLARRDYSFYYERYALFNVGGLLAAKLRGVPSVAEVNDSALIARSRPLVFKSLARAAESIALRLADRVVTISGPFRDYLAQYGNAVAGKVEVIPNAVDPSRFPSVPQSPGVKAAREAIRARYGIGDRHVLGVAGAFVAWHGLTFLLESVAEMLERDDLHVLLVGDGPVRPDIERLVAERGLVGRVTLTGFVSPAEVVQHLAAFDIGLMPDSNVHGSPMKIFEYMAMGVPIIAARYRPIEEVVTHGETGLLFEPRNADALRTVLRVALADPALRSRVGGNARNAVLANYTWQRVAERTLGTIVSGASPAPNRPLSDDAPQE